MSSERGPEDDYKIIMESELFDRGFYLRSYSDVAEASIDPLLHFCEHGWREGRDPAPFFSTRFYTKSVSSDETLVGNPFVHYVQIGFHKRARTRPEAMGPAELIPIIRGAQWQSISPRKEASGLDIIVPVYRGARDTAACLFSVLTCKTSTPFRLVVVNDKSPEARIHKLLGALAKRGLFHYINNDANLGFPGSVNKGMELDPQSHKLLLNSDTIVYDGWLDRLMSHAQREKRIGTITPLSNNATIFSYPETNASNNYSVEVPFFAIDRFAAVANKRQIVDVPTGVGFCMFIRKECLMEVGGLDAATFNKGYGEENDFCARAARAGWRNVAATDVFVRHTGEVSFALDAAVQQKSGYVALLKKHPRYESEVRKFIARDSLRPARQRMDTERLVFECKQRKIVLFVSHNQGGGIETHLRHVSKLLSEKEVAILIVSPNPTDPFVFAVNLLDRPLRLPNLRDLKGAEFIDVVLPRLLTRSQCTVHFHSAVGFDLRELSSLLKNIKSRGVRIVSTLHDYAAVCPRHQLVDDGEDYCGIPSESACNLCVRSFAYNGRDRRDFDVKEYRLQYRELLGFADRTYTPSADTRSRLQPHLPDLKIEVRKHIEPVVAWPIIQNRGQHAGSAAPIRVAIIGAIGPHKGSSVVFACAADAVRRDLPISFHVVGYTNNDERLKDVGVSISGPYHTAEQMVSTLNEIGPDVAFFPSIWPETYLYTLSAAFSCGIFPIAFDIGAQAERIREAEWGALIDFEDRHNPEFINDGLVSVGQQVRCGDVPFEKIVLEAHDDVANYYGYSFAQLEKLTKQSSGS